MPDRCEPLDAQFRSAWRDLTCGRIDKFLVGKFLVGGRRETPAQIVFPGSFNPLHDGHRQMAEIATQQLGAPVDFEISIENVDKLPLDEHAVAARLRQFAGDQRIWITRAPTFVEKARLFQGATFVVGADTLQRIALAKYYRDDAAAAEKAIAQIAANDCRFLVFGRTVENRFQSLEDLRLPKALAEICMPVDASAFREDISSTELRQRETDAEA